MPRPIPTTSSSDSEINSDSSVTNEVDLVIGDLYSSDVIQNQERPRLLSFNNIFKDLELRCVCRTERCRYSWPQRVSERPMYAYQAQDIECSSIVNLKPQRKNTKHSNNKPNAILSKLRNIASYATNKNNEKLDDKKNRHDANKPDNVLDNENLTDTESDSGSTSATCDLTIPFQSYIDSLKYANEETSSISSSDSTMISTDYYSDEEFRRIAEAGRLATINELKLVEIITPSPVVRLLWMDTSLPLPCTNTTTEIVPNTQSEPFQSSNTPKAVVESTIEEKLPNVKRKKWTKKLKISKPKFLKTIKNKSIVSESTGAESGKSSSMLQKSKNTYRNKSSANTSGSPLLPTVNTDTIPSKVSFKNKNAHVTEQNEIRQVPLPSSIDHSDEKQNYTNYSDNKELCMTGASNIHNFLVHNTTHSRLREDISSSDDSDSTVSEVDEDEVRSIAHDLQSLQIVTNIDNPIRLIGFGKLETNSVANQQFYLPSNRSNRFHNKKFTLSNIYPPLNECEPNKCPDLMSGDISDVNTSDSEDDTEDGWRAVFDFTKPIYRNFTQDWSSDMISTDQDTSSNSDMFSSDDDNLDLNYSYNVLQLKKTEGLTKSEKLRESVPIKLIGFNSANTTFI